MKREQIIEMLKELVQEIDYDIYKEMFEYEEIDYECLIRVVKKHVNL